MKAHIEIMHKRSTQQSISVNANALLGFGQIKDEDHSKKIKQDRPKLEDTEGKDYGYYFTNKYQMVHQSHPERGGRGGRGGRGRGGA